MALQQAPPLHAPEMQELLVAHAVPALPGTTLGRTGAPGRGVAAALALTVLLGEGVPLVVRLEVALPVKEERRLGVAVAVGVPLRLAEVEGLGEALVVAHEVPETMDVALEVEETEALCVTLGEGDSDEQALAEPLPLREGALLSVAGALAVAVRVAAAEEVGDAQAVAVPMTREEGDARGESEGVPPALPVLLRLGVAEP